MEEVPTSKGSLALEELRFSMDLGQHRRSKQKGEMVWWFGDWNMLSLFWSFSEVRSLMPTVAMKWDIPAHCSSEVIRRRLQWREF